MRRRYNLKPRRNFILPSSEPKQSEELLRGWDWKDIISLTIRSVIFSYQKGQHGMMLSDSINGDSIEECDNIMCEKMC